MAATGAGSVAVGHPFLGALELTGGSGPGGAAPSLLFCENETNTARLFGAEPVTLYPKDGINDHVISGAATVNPQRTGTKCAFWYQVRVQPGATAELRLRLRPATAARGKASDPLGAEFDQVIAQRRAEADEFYAELTPATANADEAMVMRQAFAGLLWSKQLYYYDVARWLDGDPAQPAPPPQRRTGRNSRWRHFDAFDIMSMPDKWEYPWFAAWDLAFHCVALAHVDPAFAKYQSRAGCTNLHRASPRRTPISAPCAARFTARTAGPASIATRTNWPTCRPARTSWPTCSSAPPPTTSASTASRWPATPNSGPRSFSFSWTARGRRLPS